MNQMKTNRSKLRIKKVQIMFPATVGQRRFGRINRLINSRANIPHTITYTGINGAAGHSCMYTAPVDTEQRHLEKEFISQVFIWNIVIYILFPNCLDKHCTWGSWLSIIAL